MTASMLLPTSLLGAQWLSQPNTMESTQDDIPDFARPSQKGPADGIQFRKRQDARIKDLCPCCRLPLKARHQMVDITPAMSFSRQQSATLIRESSVSLLSEDCEDLSAGDMDESESERSMLPGLLGQGSAYTVREVIAQGCLQKKGSGLDFLGSRYWKGRWVRLSWAKVEDSPVDVPLLEVYWASTASTASTVISLDSAVVIPVNNHPDSSNPFRFVIRHIKKSVNDSDSSLQITRMFSCPKETRDDWVYFINQALLEYEKSKASALRLQGLSLSSPPMSLYTQQRYNFSHAS